MRLTLEADYAIRIIYCLSKDRCRLEAKTIAERSCITLRFALKILRKLVSAGLVRSYKGTRGGYELNMEPSEISLCKVIETIDGTYFFSRCLAPDSICTRTGGKGCGFQKVFNEVTHMVKDKLDIYTFDMFIE